MSKPLWKTAQVDDQAAEDLASAVRIPLRIARWLCARGIGAEEAAAYLDAHGLPPFDPTLFTDLNLAVSLLQQAVSEGTRVLIVGDYDVDGVTASAILASALERLGADVVCEIPHRIHDGYGLQPHMIDRLQALQARLLVTVDNGIVSHEAVAMAKQLGMSVIVTDHHEPGESPPAADAVVHWSRSGDRDACHVLSGAGVAYQLAQRLLDVHSVLADDPIRPWLTGLAAIGALADVMPMRGENRRIVNIGLRALQTCSRPGWRALCKTAGCLDEPLTDRTVLWQITPRLNAAGRMESAALAYALLMTDSDAEAEALAAQIEQANQLRRAETERSYKEALAQLAGESQPSAVVAAGDWHLGVAGIVAARLVEAFGCPAIVLCDMGTDILKGSGRAPEGLSLHAALTECTDWLHHFGGHAAAVGCGVHRDHVDGFRQALRSAMAQQSQAGETQMEQWLADDFLPLSEANTETLRWLDRLSPYGPGFPVFRFYVGPLRIASLDWLKGGKYLKLSLQEDSHRIDAIWFSPTEHSRGFAVGDWVCAIAELTSNVWRGQERIQLSLVQAAKVPEVRHRDHFAAVYRLLRTARSVGLPQVLASLPQESRDGAQLMLETFVELGFATRTASAYHVVEYATPRDLRESRTYQQHLAQALSKTDL